MNPLKFLFLSKKDPTQNADPAIVDQIDVNIRIKRIAALDELSLRETEMEKLLAKFPSNIVALTEMAYIYADAGKYEKHISCQQEILSLSYDIDDQSVAYMEIGTSFNRMKKFPEAINAYLKAIGLSNQNFMAYWELGDVYLALGQYEKAKENYLRFYNHDPAKNSKVSNNLAIAESALGNYEQSVIYMQDAIAIEPGNSRWYINMAALYVQFKKSTALLKHLETACAIIPGDFRLLSEYAKHLVLYHQKEKSLKDEVCIKALQLAKSAFHINPDEVEARLIYATTLYACLPQNKEAVQEAIDVLAKTEALTELDFDRKRIYYFLSEAYKLAGEPLRARKFMDKGLQLEFNTGI